jgi:hypothetical protein
MILRPASSLTNKLSIKVHVARIYPFVLPSQWLPTPNLHATLQLTCGPAVLTNVTPHTAFVCRSFLPLSSRPASPSIHKDAILHSAAALVQRQAKLIRSTSLAPNASRKAISAIDGWSDRADRVLPIKTLYCNVRNRRSRQRRRRHYRRGIAPDRHN